MSGPKSIKSPTAWLVPSDEPLPTEAFKRRVRNYGKAEDALNTLITNEVDEDVLWRHLWGLAWLAKSKGKAKTRGYAMPGVPAHTLRRFPVKLSRMADEIEQLERKLRSDQLHAAVNELLPLFLRPKTTDQFLERDGLELEDRQEQISRLQELPKMLRGYAADLATRVKTAVRYRSMGERLYYQFWPLHFIWFVTACTGRPHLLEVATLLSASYQAVGCDLDVDPKALAMLASRLPRKR